MDLDPSEYGQAIDVWEAQRAGDVLLARSGFSAEHSGPCRPCNRGERSQTSREGLEIEDRTDDRREDASKNDRQKNGSLNQLQLDSSPLSPRREHFLGKQRFPEILG
jgi:hypothetical protein